MTVKPGLNFYRGDKIIFHMKCINCNEIVSKNLIHGFIQDNFLMECKFCDSYFIVKLKISVETYITPVQISSNKKSKKPIKKPPTPESQDATNG